MYRGLLQELRLARQSFSFLAMTLLVLPLLLSIGPRPNQATVGYIAGLAGYVLCSASGYDTDGQKQIPQNPCKDCLNGAQGANIVAIIPQAFGVLYPPRLLSGTLCAQARPLQTIFMSAIEAARGPPRLI